MNGRFVLRGAGVPTVLTPWGGLKRLCRRLQAQGRPVPTVLTPWGGLKQRPGDSGARLVGVPTVLTPWGGLKRIGHGVVVDGPRCPHGADAVGRIETKPVLSLTRP